MSKPPRGFHEDTSATTPHGNPIQPSGPRRPCLLVVAGARLGEIFPIEGELIIGRDADVQLRINDDEGISRRHARVTAQGDSAVIVDLGSANGVFVDGQKISERLLVEGQKIRVGQTTVLKFARYDAMEEHAQRQLLESALRDVTTHAFNRRYFLQRLGGEIRFADRHHMQLALLIIDLDHFKKINDTYGHYQGDEVLRQVVILLNNALRAEDVLARFGGEEFAVLARGIPEGGALQLAERLRKLVETTDFGTAQKPLHCTISVGVAVFPFEGSQLETAAMEKLIERADAALYRAKQAGRNQTAK
jgi:diguanylate cyclase (GGDEF)-like protein